MILYVVNSPLAYHKIGSIRSRVRMSDIKPNTPWSRFIAFADMNAFFASIEQLDNQHLRGKPVGITNGKTGTCLITCSYEARKFGIHTGMRLKEARKLCPEIIQVAARPERYTEVSTGIMEAFLDITPDVEVSSCDEAYLDITHCQNYWKKSPEAIGRMIKKKVLETSGVKCSVGISGDKTTAKFAAKQQKPDGLTIILPWEALKRLENVPVTDLCGIGPGIGEFLRKRGVKVCGDMARIPMSAVADRFGPPGARIWMMCRAEDPAPVETVIKPPKSMGHGKVMPPNTTDRNILYMYLIHMGEKLGYRLRQNELVAQKFFIGLRTYDGWVGSNKLKTRVPTNDSRMIHELSTIVLDEYWQGEGIHQVQITALDPRGQNEQSDLFDDDTSKIDRLNAAMDKINNRYGEFTIEPAIMLDRSDMPNVIAPAWKPYGHRQTIVPTVERKKIVKTEQPKYEPDYMEYLRTEAAYLEHINMSNV